MAATMSITADRRTRSRIGVVLRSCGILGGLCAVALVTLAPGHNHSHNADPQNQC
jgi:hypothetical protein